MPLTTIQLVLRDKYHFLSRSTGLFFRFKLKEYPTEGVNQNKKIFPKAGISNLTG